MIAYFALLAFVPLLFLALSLTALAGQPGETNYLIEELRRMFPATSVDRIIDVVEGIQEQATSLGIVGGIGLSGLARILQRARVRVQHRLQGLPNRPFVPSKAFVLLLTAAALVVLFVALVVGSIGVDLLRRAGVAGDILVRLRRNRVDRAALRLSLSLYKLLER